MIDIPGSREGELSRRELLARAGGLAAAAVVPGIMADVERALEVLS